MSYLPPSIPHPITTIPSIMRAKGQKKLVVLTAYTAPIAALIAPHCDMLLVGDSLGMVVYGLPSTLGVTLEMMINHGAGVVRAAPGACVIIDMPFGSYEASPKQAFTNAARLLKDTGCMAVKLEGGVAMAQTIRYLSDRAIPVMAHIGLMPQHSNRMGGFKTQGREDASYRAILDDAKAVQKAGAFAVVIEGVVEPLAAEITRALTIPTIGIGASAQCDGQVLVIDDLLGMTDHPPRFVKPYAAMRPLVDTAVATYAAEVRAGTFPSDAHCYGVVTAVTKKTVS